MLPARYMERQAAWKSDRLAGKSCGKSAATLARNKRQYGL